MTVLITFVKFENVAPLYEREIKRNSSKFLNTKTHLVTPNLKGVSKTKRVVYLKSFQHHTVHIIAVVA